MVTVHLPPSLVRMLGMSERTLQVQAATIGEMLAALEAVRPGIWDRLCEADGSIRQHLNVFVGERNARLDGGPALTLGEGEAVWIIPAVSGGSGGHRRGCFLRGFFRFFGFGHLCHRQHRGDPML